MHAKKEKNTREEKQSKANKASFPAFLPVSMDSYNIRFTNTDEYTRSSTIFTQSIHSTTIFFQFLLAHRTARNFFKKKKLTNFRIDSSDPSKY